MAEGGHIWKVGGREFKIVGAAALKLRSPKLWCGGYIWVCCTRPMLLNIENSRRHLAILCWYLQVRMDGWSVIHSFIHLFIGQSSQETDWLSVLCVVGRRPIGMTKTWRDTWMCRRPGHSQSTSPVKVSIINSPFTHCLLAVILHHCSSSIHCHSIVTSFISLSSTNKSDFRSLT